MNVAENSGAQVALQWISSVKQDIGAYITDQAKTTVSGVFHPLHPGHPGIAAQPGGATISSSGIRGKGVFFR